MEEFLKQINENPLFNGIAPKDFDMIFNCMAATKISYKKNKIIVNLGDKLNFVGVLLSGSVRFTYYTEDGYDILIGELSAPTVFLDTFVNYEKYDPSPVTVIAKEDCEALLIDYNRVITFCQKTCGFHKQVLKNFLRSHQEKTHYMIQLAGVLSKRTTREKIICFLNIHRGSEKKFTIPYNRDEMAQYLCVNRTGLSEELSKMKDEGLIRFHRNEFEIL